MTATEELRALGCRVRDRNETARFITRLWLTNDQKAHLLRRVFREQRWAITREVLVIVRDFSFHL